MMVEFSDMVLLITQAEMMYVNSVHIKLSFFLYWFLDFLLML